MMQKGQHDQSKVNVTYSYASEQGLQQRATAPNPPTETQLTDPLSFMAKARWFVLGLLGGIFAMIAKLALPTKMGFEQRKQSEWAVWAGFAVNTFLHRLLGHAYRKLIGHGGSPCICFSRIWLGGNRVQHTLSMVKRPGRSARVVFCGACLVFVEA